jgi:hypothetical protein
MDNASKALSLLIVAALVASSIIIVESAFAQSIPKPSVPEFTAKLISSPSESLSVNKTIELSIKNQPSVSDYGFFYMVRARINDGNWSLLYTIDNVPGQSSGEYTTLSYPSDQPVVEYQYALGDKLKNLFPGDMIDFQVQAMIGHIHRVYNPNHTTQLDMYPYVFTGETSDWSDTQTISIPAGSPAPTDSEGDDSLVSAPLNIFIVVVAVLVVVIISVLLYARHKR